MHVILIYDLVDDYVERRAALRAEHLDLGRQSLARNELVLAGALAEPIDQAMLVFRGEDPAVAEAFAKSENGPPCSETNYNGRTGVVPRGLTRSSKMGLYCCPIRFSIAA